MENRQRYLNLDILKALGIIYIIILHHIIWMYLPDDGDLLRIRYPGALSLVVNYACHTGLHVLGFQIPLLAGATFFLSFKRKYTAWPVVLRRSFGLAALGFLMNFLSWGVSDMFDWDVLQFIAISMIISYPFLKKFPHRWGTAALLILGCAALYFSDRFPLLHLKDSYLYIIVFGSPAGEHYWALCPWFILFALGVFIGDKIAGNQKIFKYLPVPGIILMTISLVSGYFAPLSNVKNAWGPSLFKPSPFFVLGIMGFSLAAVPFTDYLLRRFRSLNDALQKSFLLYYSYGILWIYLITTIAGWNITDRVARSFHMSFGQSVIILFLLILADLCLAFFVGRFVYNRKTKT